MNVDSPLALASRSVSDGIAATRAASYSGDDEALGALTAYESLARQVEQLAVELVARLDRRGVFTDRGYARAALAVADLLGCDTGQAARWVRAGEQITQRVSLDGQELPPRLPATAEAFAAGELSLRHVEVIAEALGSRSAERLAPQVWAEAEQQLAAHARLYRPRELATFAVALVTALDQDGAPPDEHEPPQVNELHLARYPASGGGRIKGTLDAPTFAVVATALDALSKPAAEDRRSLPERQADALGDLCNQLLDRAELPTCGGERPHLNVIIPLAELEGRARGAVLDYGGQLTATDLRVLACDARVLPVVLGGAGQPLDVGRAMRTVPPHLRRTITVRDRGCAFPGCDRGPSWCDVHHVTEWQHGGRTDITNLVMLCRAHHRLLHHSGWIVRIRDGRPEFVPPKWVDSQLRPRRKPPPGRQQSGRRPANLVDTWPDLDRRRTDPVRDLRRPTCRGRPAHPS